MDRNELKRLLIPHILQLDYESCLHVLTDFESSGGDQLVACDMLQVLREDKITSHAEDFILELMDVVSGWCPSDKWIWREPLDRRYLLYRITGVEPSESDTVLLPGLFCDERVSLQMHHITVGAMIEIRFADGRRIETPVTNFFVRPTIGADGQLDIKKTPVVLCVSKDVLLEGLDSGAEVWIRI